MSDEQKFQVAKEYVDRQLETVESIDSVPAHLSEEEYRHLIEDVAELITA